MANSISQKLPRRGFLKLPAALAVTTMLGGSAAHALPAPSPRDRALELLAEVRAIMVGPLNDDDEGRLDLLDAIQELEDFATERDPRAVTVKEVDLSRRWATLPLDPEPNVRYLPALPLWLSVDERFAPAFERMSAALMSMCDESRGYYLRSFTKIAERIAAEPFEA